MVVSVACFLSIFLVLQPWSIATSAGDILAPLLSPIFEDACNNVKCGQGTCKPSGNSTIPYVCECSPGWGQLATAADDDDHFLKFLPCVIPNCTLDYSCSKAPSPVQEKEKRGNASIFDVCSWTDCGGGKCETTSLFTHKCECDEGYHNLLNLTFSPCLKECSLGMDCKDLGLRIANNSPPPSSLSDDSNLEDVCNNVKCGQGTCKASDNSTIPFECECSPGWKQLAIADDDHNFKFLPCVIPSCTLDNSCSKAPSPVQEKDNRGNTSIFDVCSWTDCGGGKCKTTSLFTHKCECDEGYRNLLNLTFSPCFKECSLGMDCKDLGLRIANNPPPSSSSDDSNLANIRLEGQGSFNWLIFVLVLFGYLTA